MVPVTDWRDKVNELPAGPIDDLICAARLCAKSVGLFIINLPINGRTSNQQLLNGAGNKDSTSITFQRKTGSAIGNRKENGIRVKTLQGSAVSLAWIHANLAGIEVRLRRQVHTPFATEGLGPERTSSAR